MCEPQVVDKTLNRLFHYIHDNCDESRPLSDSSVPPRCDFESYFAISEPQSLARPRMGVYPRAQSCWRRVNELASLKPLFKVIPLQRKVSPVAEAPDFAAPQFLNPDFARISNNKNIPKT